METLIKQLNSGQVSVVLLQKINKRFKNVTSFCANIDRNYHHPLKISYKNRQAKFEVNTKMVRSLIFISFKT